MKTKTNTKAKVSKKPAKAKKPLLKKGKAPKAAKVKKVQVGPAGGLKIEKDRDEQNGITRPSIGGICRAIWDACDNKGREVTVREIKEHGAAKGWNMTTTTIQFYQWRAFNGIESRRGKGN